MLFCLKRLRGQIVCMLNAGTGWRKMGDDHGLTIKLAQGLTSPVVNDTLPAGAVGEPRAGGSRHADHAETLIAPTAMLAAGGRPVCQPAASRTLALAGVMTLTLPLAAHAQTAGLGEMLGTHAAADMVNFGSDISLAFYLVAGVAFLAGVLGALANHRGRHAVPWGGVLTAFGVSFACAGAPALIGAGTQTMTQAVPGIDAATAIDNITWN